MHWIQNYQLFLFDFDGILVNTEELHYLAYKKMCADRGYTLSWDMTTYIRHAMYSSEGMQEGIYRAFPDLQKEEPNWDVLYKEKKSAYAHLLVTKGVSLMPGVELLLKTLERLGCKRCVVTHSSAAQVALIQEQQPLLKGLPHWVTREDYSRPKPASECYQMAITKWGEKGDRVIGFEDSPRGLRALLGTEAEGVLVTELFSQDEVKNLAHELRREFLHVSSFKELA